MRACLVVLVLLLFPATASACPPDSADPAVPQTARDHICGAWDAAVARGLNPGTALNNTHKWGNGYIRDFDHGALGRGGIMERHGIGWAYVVGTSFWQTFVAVGGATGPLGYPKGDFEWAGHLKSGPRENQYMTFEGGVINKWAAGTFATWGAIRDRWDRSGNVAGPLGRPLSNEQDAAVGPHHSTKGRFSRFEHGVINYNPAVNGAFAVFGGILKRYTQLGYSGSHLGLPISEEEPWHSGGVRQRFEGGYVFWHPGDDTGHTSDDCPIARGDAPQEIKDHMCATWNAAGFPNLGHPINAIHRWNDGWIVDFDGGRWGRGGILEGDGVGWAHAIGQPYFGALVRAGGTGRIGYPTGRREFAGHINDGPRGNRYMTFTRGVINSSSHGAFAVYGAIRARWDAMGHVTGVMGQPIGDEGDTARVPGRYQAFEGGNLIWDPVTGHTWHVYGGILNKYRELGFSEHPLGLPTSDRQQGRRSEYQVFQGGVINQYDGRAFETHGAIHRRWDHSRHVDGPLGLPTSDELPTARSPQGTVGRYNTFENGIINYNPRVDRAVVLFGAIKDKYASLGYASSYLGLPTSEEYDYDRGKRQDFEGGYIHWLPGVGARTNQELDAPPQPPVPPAAESGIRPPDIQAVVFRPRLRLDEQERWAPLDIHSWFAKDRPLRTPSVGLGTRLTSPSQLDSRATGIDYAPLGDGGIAPALYYTSADDSGYRYIDYWWFFRYNDAWAGDAFDHYGDWEGVTVGVSRRSGRMDFVRMAQHNDVKGYLRGMLQCDGQTSCTDQATRVDAYVADGTHASYPEPCDFRCNISERGNDGKRPWAANENGGVLHEFVNGGWVHWKGLWGPPHSPSAPPHSPGEQTRYISNPGAVGVSAGVPVARAAAADVSACDGWLGAGVTATVCDEQELRSALEQGRLGDSGDVDVASAGRSSASAPGLAQLGGEPLQANQQLTISGSGARGAVAQVRAADRAAEYVAEFRGVEGGTVVRARRRGGRLVLTGTTSTGRTIAPERVRRTSRRAPRAPGLSVVGRRGRRLVLKLIARTRTTAIHLRATRRGMPRVTKLVRSSPMRIGRVRRVTLRLPRGRARYVTAVSIGENEILSPERARLVPRR